MDYKDYNRFEFPKEWVKIAMSRNSLSMAALVYDSIKKQKHSGVFPHPELIDTMLNVLKNILYEEYGWQQEQLDKLQNKFEELNKYYPTSQPEGTIEVRMSSNDLLNGKEGQQEKRGKNKKVFIKKEFIKALFRIIFEITIYWLALIGLITLLGF